MKLDKHVVDMFTELTKPADDVKMEKTCYGTISVVDGTRYVKLDGSDLLVPAASTVKTSHGDRVTVLMKNHSLTVTGNLTAPATDGEGGSSGEAGTAATIEVGTVTTGEAGSSATVTNVGTTSAAVFDFVIPRGDKGEKGDTGPQGPQGEKGDTGTWDGTIPEHEHTVSDITDFPTSLPADGGNADTLDGFHANDFASSDDNYFLCTLSAAGNKHGDAHRLYAQHNVKNDGRFYLQDEEGGHQVRVNYADNADNANTVDGKRASDFYQVASGLRTDASYYDIFSTTLSYSHACWNKWCYIVGNSIDSSTSDYIDNAPEALYALWYEVFTGGHYSRAFQIAFGCFSFQRKTFIRYMHDGEWSGWHNIADGGNANTAKSVQSTTGKALLWEDSEGGNLRLVSPDGKHYAEMDLYDNNVFRIYFVIEGTTVVPALTYDFTTGKMYINGNADTVDGLHANEIASNPNLLINPDFKINQRGKSEYTAAGYTVDRWAAQSNCKVTPKSSGGVRLDCLGTVNNGFYQKYDGDLSGNTVTLSLKASGSGSLRLGVWGTGIKTVTLDDTPRIYSHTFELGDDPTFGMWLSANGEYAEIEWTKFEIGSIATPFVPPEATIELLKCRRYYQKLCFFRVPMAYHDVNRITWFIPFVPMRTLPTVTINTGGMYLDGMPSGSQPTDFAVAWAVGTDPTSASGCIRVNCSYSSSWETSIANGSWNAPLTANNNNDGLLLDAELY